MSTAKRSEQEKESNQRSPLKRSVIRHKNPGSGNSFEHVRKQLSNQDLRDIFAGLSISQRQAVAGAGTGAGAGAGAGANELSTVAEENQDGAGEQYATLTEENIERLNSGDEKSQGTYKKSAFLQRYAESAGNYGDEYGDFDEFREAEDADDSDNVSNGDFEGEDFDGRIRDSLKQGRVPSPLLEEKKSANPFSMPVSKFTMKSTRVNAELPKSESFQSLSSASTGKSAPSITSTTSFTETDSEQNDYAEDFADVDFDKVDLINKFRLRQKNAETNANNVKQERKKRYQKLQSCLKGSRSLYFSTHRDYIEQGQNIIRDDFEDFDNLDPKKLRRFQVVDPLDSRYEKLDRKRSMPVLLRSGSGKTANVSPKRSVRKYSSTLDLPSQMAPRYHESISNRYPPVSLSLKARPYYNGSELDDIDDLSPDDLTITLSDYKKLKRKSQRIDLTQYAEENTIKHHVKRGHHHRHQTQQQQQQQQQHYTLTNTARLNKEGKLKIIRSMGKHRTKQVLPGHMYGEIVYDPDQMKWCGNEEELAGFESTSRPSLIRHRISQGQFPKISDDPFINSNKNDISRKNINSRNKGEQPQIVGNMVYDNNNLRWVSLTGKYEDDPFENLDDTITSDRLGPLEGYQRNNNFQEEHPRTVTTGSSRMTSSTSSSSISNYLARGEEKNNFEITPETYKLWKSEESRWLRKVGNWFPSEEDDLEFCYELKSFLDDQ
ncbi:hypothetical protein FOA43_004107 [Brettanomyces nanus]|uniref:Uncharacterized protein n=1 Tax=Eeniella nana TaxID=13502 RepID=A0A875S729_EENNA|nr:uncharacterized protein FOA43_004107 [Brettanomyces nanus]QPG76713.1 hypothetical protein FOA43_004107 [Brettanomyces nanus]